MVRLEAHASFPASSPKKATSPSEWPASRFVRSWFGFDLAVLQWDIWELSRLSTHKHGVWPDPRWELGSPKALARELLQLTAQWVESKRLLSCGRDWTCPIVYATPCPDSSSKGPRFRFVPMKPRAAGSWFQGQVPVSWALSSFNLWRWFCRHSLLRTQNGWRTPRNGLRRVIASPKPSLPWLRHTLKQWLVFWWNRLWRWNARGRESHADSLLRRVAHWRPA